MKKIFSNRGVWLSGFCREMLILDFSMGWQMAGGGGALFMLYKQRRGRYLNQQN
jgi:hypothetical protein